MTLVLIAPGRALAAPHAATWNEMLGDGMPNRPQDINSASRTREEQKRFYDDYLYYLRTGKTRPSGVKLAAKPGTSNHEFPPGSAIDIKTGSPTHKWLVANGPKYGVTRPLLNKGEPHHFEFGARQTVSVPRPTNTFQENDMRVVATASGRRFVLGELTYQDMTKRWDHASHEAKIWNSDTGDEPDVIPDATLDLAIGQIQQRRAQLAEALKELGV